MGKTFSGHEREDGSGIFDVYNSDTPTGTPIFSGTYTDMMAYILKQPSEEAQPKAKAKQQAEPRSRENLIREFRELHGDTFEDTIEEWLQQVVNQTTNETFIDVVSSMMFAMWGASIMALANKTGAPPAVISRYYLSRAVNDLLSWDQDSDAIFHRVQNEDSLNG